MTDKKWLMNGEHWKQSSLNMILTGVFTAGLVIGSGQLIGDNIFRPDAFRGTDAKEMQEVIEKRIDREHKATDKRLEDIEIQVRGLLATNNQLLLAIAKLPPDEWQQRIRALEIWSAQHDVREGRHP